MSPPDAAEQNHTPFLRYSDDPEAKDPGGPHHHHDGESARSRAWPFILTFLVTSLLWVLLIAVLVDLPVPSVGSRPPPQCTECKCATPAPAPAAPASRPETVHNHDEMAEWAAGTATATTATSTSSRHNITTGRTLLTCGTTPAEARARGCRYDAPTSHWVPAPCWERERERERADDDGGGYADAALTQRLSAQDVSERGGFYYTSVRDRAGRCAVLWRRQFWALFEDDGGAVDTVLVGFGDMDGCARYLSGAPGVDWSAAVVKEVGFAGCWVE